MGQRPVRLQAETGSQSALGGLVGADATAINICLGQGLGEASDREVRRRGAIDDRRNDAGRKEGKGGEQADFNATFVEMAIHVGFIGLLAYWTFVL